MTSGQLITLVHWMRHAGNAQRQAILSTVQLLSGTDAMTRLIDAYSARNKLDQDDHTEADYRKWMALATA